MNIGSRQHGRERGKNVVDVGYDNSEIVKKVSEQVQHGKYDSDHLYGDGYACEKIISVLESHHFLIQKTNLY